MRAIDMMLIWALAFVCLLSSRNALAQDILPSKADFHLQQAVNSLDEHKRIKAWEELSMVLYHDPINLFALQTMSEIAGDIDRAEDTISYWQAALCLENTIEYQLAYVDFLKKIAPLQAEAYLNSLDDIEKQPALLHAFINLIKNQGRTPDEKYISALEQFNNT